MPFSDIRFIFLVGIIIVENNLFYCIGVATRLGSLLSELELLGTERLIVANFIFSVKCQHDKHIYTQKSGKKLLLNNHEQ